MIIFYRKSDGEIIGSIDGRIHDEGHMRMWYGGKENDRIVINWRAIKWYDKTGKELPAEQRAVAYAADFEPALDDEKQKEIAYKLDIGEIRADILKVDLDTKKLVYK